MRRRRPCDCARAQIEVREHADSHLAPLTGDALLATASVPLRQLSSGSPRAWQPATLRSGIPGGTMPSYSSYSTRT